MLGLACSHRVIALLAGIMLAPAVARASALDLRAVAVSAPIEAIESSRLAVTATVASDGTSAAPAFRLSIVLAPEVALDRGIVVARLGPITLGVGETRVLNEVVTLPPGTTGSFYVALLVDSADAVREGNELDNVAWSSGQVRIQPRRADLAVSSVRVSELERRAGETFHVAYAVENLGALAATFSVALHASANDRVTTADPELDRASLMLDPGERRTGTFTGVVPLDARAGPLAIAVIADGEGALPERSETNNVGEAEAPLVVFEDALTLTSTTLPSGTLGLDYVAVLSASGGDGRYAYRVVDGALPTGLGLDATQGIIRGTPSASGTFTFELEASSHGLSSARRLTIAIAGTGMNLRIVSAELPGASFGLPYEERLVAFGGEPPYAWSIIDGAGALPPGLTLAPEGVLSGQPTTLGVFAFRVSVRDRLGYEDHVERSIEVSPAITVLIVGPDAPKLRVGVPADVALEAIGGVPPYRWTAVSTLPPGLSLSEQGHLIGTPRGVGRFPVLVRARDATRVGAEDSRLVQVVIEDDGALEIVTTSLPVALLRSKYASELEARGGEAPLSWSLVRGDSLPPGVFLVAGPGDHATLRGTPVRPVVHAFGLEVRDAAGRTARQTYVFEVPPPGGRVETGCACVSARGKLASAVSALLMGALGLALGRRRRAARSQGVIHEEGHARVASSCGRPARPPTR